MIVEKQSRTIERGNVSDGIRASVTLNAKAFEVLSSTIYSDKISAVIREICSNAYDAHVEAGKGDVPFTVHLPNGFEPFFSVKDDGVGLSDEDVHHLYMTYFGTTKDGSNNFVGHFGLGAKVPFAYTDTFTVVSRFGGMKRTYSIHLDEEGVPTTTRMGEMPTDEPNGLEVSLPVKETDFGTFASRARDVLKWFDPIPKVIGNSAVYIEAPIKILTGDGWFLRKGTDWSAVALQGPVAYPIDWNSLSYSSLTTAQKAVLEIGPAIEFPMGTLRMTASRESLNYDPVTIENVKKRIAEIAEELPQTYQAELDQCQSRWDAYIWYDTTVQPFDYLKKLLKGRLIWRGEAINNNVLTVKVDWNDPISLTYLVPGVFNHYSRRERLTFHHSVSIPIIPKKTKIIWNPTKFGAGKMLSIFKIRMNQGLCDNCLFINTPDPVLRDKVLDDLGNHDFEDVSTWEVPETVAQARRRRIGDLIPMWCYEYRSFVKCDVPSDHGGIYVNMSGRDVSDPTSFHSLCSAAREAGLLDFHEVIYGIPATYKNLPKKHKNWVHLTDVLRKRCLTLLDERAISEIKDLVELEHYSAFSNIRFFINNDLEPKKASRPLGKLFRAIKKVPWDDRKVLYNIDTLATLLGLERKTYKPRYNFKQLIDEVNTTYPLYSKVHVTDVDTATNLMEYIDFMDKRRNQ